MLLVWISSKRVENRLFFNIWETWNFFPSIRLRLWSFLIIEKFNRKNNNCNNALSTEQTNRRWKNFITHFHLFYGNNLFCSGRAFCLKNGQTGTTNILQKVVFAKKNFLLLFAYINSQDFHNFHCENLFFSFWIGQKLICENFFGLQAVCQLLYGNFSINIWKGCSGNLCQKPWETMWKLKFFLVSNQRPFNTHTKKSNQNHHKFFPSPVPLSLHTEEKPINFPNNKIHQ